MTLNRYNPKRDANEPEIIHGLRKAGCWVHQISAPGMPDLLCCSRGTLFLVEVKMPGAVLTPKQRLFFESELLPHDVPVYVLRSSLDIEHTLTRLHNRIAAPLPE